MNAPSTAARPGWVKLAALFVLAAGGLGVGLLLANRESPPAPQPAAPTLPSTPSETAVHRFALTAADAKETVEAPVLTADAGGRVYLAWASRTGENEKTLFLTRSDDAARTFTPARFVAKSEVFKAVSRMKGKEVTREVRMAPHLGATGASLRLAWTEALPNNAGVRMTVATSADRGNTFGTPTPTHQGANARPTYTAFAAGPDGAMLASWLDNRNGSQQCYASFRPATAEAFEPELLVHAGDDGKGVCPCCPTAALVAPDGTLYVAFRNVANGYRDITIGVKRPGGSAFELAQVVPPTWEFNGCPHDGPSLALANDVLHVVWMDARTGAQRCYHASAKRSDLKFTAQELNPGAAGTQGNPKLFADAAGGLHAVWEQSTGAEPAVEGGHKHEPAAPKPGVGRAICHRAMPVGGNSFGPARAVAPKDGAFQTRPAVTGTADNHIVIAWHELDEAGKSVAVARLPEAR